MHVLLTRPRADSAALAPLVAGLGATPLIWPLTEIVPVAAPVALPPGTEALVFTSANGVAAFAALSDERHLPVLTVGDRTAEAARAAEFARVESAGGTVEDLAALVRQRGLGRVFYPRGRDVSADLGALLGEGVRLTEQVVYAAEAAGAPPPDVTAALRAGTVAVAAIWSRRAGAILSDHIAGHADWRLDQAALVAISKRAAGAVGAGMFGSVVIADDPDAASMRAAVSAAVRQRVG